MDLQKLYFNMLREGIKLLKEAKHQVDKNVEAEAMRITVDNLEELVNKLPIHLVSSSYICDCKSDPCYTYDWEQCEDCKKKYES